MVKKSRRKILNASISRVLAAKNDWDEILKCAANPDMQIIISNTTEVGITLIKDNVHASPPESFPGKLLAFLYQRFKVFQGDSSKGMVIIPTELIPDNGKNWKPSYWNSLTRMDWKQPSSTGWKHTTIFAIHWSIVLYLVNSRLYNTSKWRLIMATVMN
ncbi:hypothetical protein [Paraflavitalea speifideaquila]|uniref:hypothetical protein n=1 Tax=Paraflavitalea speifideaquila TaxID=3076558 RepID=UPI0028ED9BEC|nr:hypothetical protein [Paraflavitalea speifideiaquila]